MKASNRITGRNIAAIIIAFAIICVVCCVFGCIGDDKPEPPEQKPSAPSKPEVPPERAYIKSVDASKLKLGVPSEAAITIFNNGSETVTKERIVMTATAVKMDDWKVNLAMKKMSAEERTETYMIDFDERIEGGESCTLCAEFDLPAKAETKYGKFSIAGMYHTVIEVYADDTLIGTRTMDLHLKA